MTDSSDERLGLPSASSWRRFELCPGSWALQGEARRLNQLAHESSPAAQRGSLIHAFLAGQPDEDGEEVVLTDTERTTADFLQERAQFEVTRIFGDEPIQSLNERRLWFTLGGKRVASGRFDRCVYTNKKALVIDFKTGFSLPEDSAEQNSQLKFLAVVVALHLPQVEEVIVEIVSGPYGIFQATYNRTALEDAWDSIVATLRAIEDPLAPLNPSVESCRYCPAINICQAVKNLVAPLVKTQLSALPDGARGAKLLDEVAILETHFKAIKKYYESKCADPTYKLPGYGLVPGNEVREISDWPKAELRLAEYLDADQLKEAQSYTIGKLEAALAKSLKLTADQAKEKLNQILNGLIVKNQNKSSLKRVSGKPKLVTVELP